MDYQLHSEQHGLDLLKLYQKHCVNSFLGILTTAEQDPVIKQQTIDAGFKFLAKPAEPAKLRSLLQSFILKN